MGGVIIPSDPPDILVWFQVRVGHMRNLHERQSTAFSFWKSVQSTKTLLQFCPVAETLSAHLVVMQQQPGQQALQILLDLPLQYFQALEQVQEQLCGRGHRLLLPVTYAMLEAVRMTYEFWFVFTGPSSSEWAPVQPYSTTLYPEKLSLPAVAVDNQHGLWAAS